MAAPSSDETLRVLENLFQILKEANVFDTSSNKPVVEFLHPKELKVHSYFFIYSNFNSSTINHSINCKFIFINYFKQYIL